MDKFYTTKEVAERNHIHPNTVRFYESVGLISTPKRADNGYRVFTELHIEQCGFIKLAMRAEIIQNGLRDKAVEIVKLLAAEEIDDAVRSAEEYSEMIEAEILNAKSAIATVERRLSKNTSKTVITKRGCVARELNVTSETIRTWERSGLITINRAANGYCVYNAEDIERLNIIRTLRCANYSLSAILRLLTRLDRNSTESVETILNTPGEYEDIISVCDKLITSLRSSLQDAYEMKKRLIEIKRKYYTLQ